jgi:hypothetical protein
MNRTDTNQILVLGATGKTGSRVAERLSAHEVSIRTAARSGADARFDWDNQATWGPTLAGPDHFFNLLAEDAVFEHVITVPGYPRRVEGRTAVAELYRPYGDALVLDRCYDLVLGMRPMASGASTMRRIPAGPAFPPSCVVISSWDMPGQRGLRLRAKRFLLSSIGPCVPIDDRLISYQR